VATPPSTSRHSIWPALPPGLRYESVAAGSYHSLALRSDGAVAAWGSNGYGQCVVPALPPGVRYQSIAAGYRHSLAIRSDGTAANGCPNSQNANGARLEASGLPSRVADSLVLRGSGMPSAATVLYFQGTVQSNGAAFGDGLRCANGFVARLGYRVNVNGASQLPSSGSAPLHTVGQIPTSGAATRYYQGWYRDASVSFCTVNRFNLTNGVAVVWVP
jgi:hypothetical protein